MTLNTWLLSAKLAWANPWPRWSSITATVLALGMSIFFLAKVVPVAQQQGSIILHYNLYFGVDETRAWSWAFLIPGVWITGTLVDLVIAYGVFRTDFHISASLFALALLWGLPWSGVLFYLILINL